MSPTGRHPFPGDPLRDVRLLKWWTGIAASVAILGLTLLYAFAFHLSSPQIVWISLTMAATAVLVIEVIFTYVYRLARSGIYPVKLAVELSPLRGFKQACQRSAEMVAELLGAEAAVVAWIDAELQELEPVAAKGFPERWLQVAARIPLAQSGLEDALRRAQVVIRPTTASDPWFCWFSESYSVAYVPLVSLDKVIGILGVAGESGTPRFSDRRLLSAIGVGVGLALDNARLYDEEKKRAERLQELAQMRSDFLVTVSHELRTPLTSVKTSAEMLLEEDESEPESPRGQLIRSIVRGINRLNTLVNDLVTIARLDRRQPELNLEPVAIGEMVGAACTLVHPLIQAKRQSLDERFDRLGPKVMADRRRFEQILVNLLSNANRFTPAGGRITVNVREEGDEVIVVVSDTGPGIPEGEREVIFEPFYRGRDGLGRRAPGMGIGLAIARSLAELHGGRIWLESGDGGSTFCLAIDRHEEPAVERVKARAG